MFNFLQNIFQKIYRLYITTFKGNIKNCGTRDIAPPETRDINSKPIMNSLSCPYCFSPNFVKRGVRIKKLEKIQLYLCSNCKRTFTAQTTKGKKHPLTVIFDSLSLYNLGYSLEQACTLMKLRFGAEISPPTLSGWITEFSDYCRFSRMRDYAMRLYPPKQMVIHKTLVHQQIYRYRFHKAKIELIIKGDFEHRNFWPLKEFLEAVPYECPHQYFLKGLRASEAPLTFSKTQMIVRSKTNYATKTCAFVLQSVKDRKLRHEALQKFMLFNDSVTVATEVPVYLTKDDLEHMQTQLGFEIYQKNLKFEIFNLKSSSNDSISNVLNIKNLEINNSLKIENCKLKIYELPKLITGHIDIIQIRNGQIHLLDYKPNAQKERPIEQLTLYAMALSRLTGLRMFEFKCAWFDERDYFEFYPLHVIYKPKKNKRRRKIQTEEGAYNINKNPGKIENVRPT